MKNEILRVALISVLVMSVASSAAAKGKGMADTRQDSSVGAQLMEALVAGR